LFIGKLLRRLLLLLIFDDKRRAQSLRRILGPKSECFHDPSLVSFVGSTRGDGLMQRVGELEPDIIAIYGTGIVPDAVLKQARIVALNMHTGLSPWYRGAACAFWPIHDGRPEMVGATVHACTSAIDGGDIYFREQAVLYRGDDLHAILGRAVIVGAEGYVRVIGQALEKRLKGEPQDLSIGREYYGSMLVLSREIKARKNLQRLSRKWPMPKS
jgi:methionyl-tRNA formyltransferase